ncbi:relaxase/mobilization nuclease domain-containing protein [Dyadobacter chenwenxiniae]|uniref:Relaxase/mobilization nuclease domain-containing protein n=1 Tax=Dyadobacter chenwenxiniae TaxID=2906456 RepID=A0A9X1TPM3_9BACT|nr:relaxase/mobilization nuclease domain-containing protein [Dyadobacter chenwenxiniae]MCF0065668.1 relaxase/mobilization nuclease domain-containing protein [Dyadobacter chenwenxiniae]UON85576.1 relaxase/mobilization nuclease domain-containing protein [Dyadobacter chenwenxiniae]
MVAVIHTSSSLRAVLSYNERKVEEEQAICLAAENYPKEATELTFNQKLNLLQKQASLNLRTKINSVHVSLNFDPSERHDPDTLRAIAGSYMDKIGFGQQPYLVYQHMDAGHPHIHLLTTNIRPDGSRISLHNLGKNQSEKARKEIEIDFNLVKADGRKQQNPQIKPAMVSANYGKVETKRAIANVLTGVVDQYKFTSIPELNAVLKQYNVMADRGSEESRTYQKGGLHYRLLNREGERVGVPIKASDFHQKPTLKFLQSKFEMNEQLRQPDKTRIKNAIDFALYGDDNVTLDRLSKTLERDGIDTVLRKNDTGLIYGITYVDHRTGSVFNGSSLGKNYSAKAIQERCGPTQEMPRNSMSNDYTIGKSNADFENRDSDRSSHFTIPEFRQHNESKISDSSDALFDPVKQDGYMPGQLRSSRRKKKKGMSQSL